jgi:hypothetical protein
MAACFFCPDYVFLLSLPKGCRYVDVGNQTFILKKSVAVGETFGGIQSFPTLCLTKFKLPDIKV